MKKHFLRWWLMVCLMVVGAVLMQIYGMWEILNNSDVTKISFLILFLFVIFTIKTGIRTYSPTKEDYKKIRTIEFFADKFLVLGMIGTVVGFIYMLRICFVGINAANPATMQAALVKMSFGMGTALFTTAAGLICSLLLKFQLFNLQQAIEDAPK
jgi:hypothetical protein